MVNILFLGKIRFLFLINIGLFLLIASSECIYGQVKECKQKNCKILFNELEKGNIQKVKELINNGINIDSKYYNMGETPLMITSEKGHEKLVEFLLIKKAKVHLLDKKGNSALILAGAALNLKCFKILLKYGASINQGNEDGWTVIDFVAMHYSISLSKKKKGNKLSDFERHHELMKILVYSDPIDMNHKKILLGASKFGHDKIAKYLIGKEVNIKIYDEKGITPLMYATMLGNIDIVKLLISKGANVNAKDLMLNTPLDFAKYNKRKAIIKILKDAGAKEKNN